MQKTAINWCKITIDLHNWTVDDQYTRHAQQLRMLLCVWSMLPWLPFHRTYIVMSGILKRYDTSYPSKLNARLANGCAGLVCSSPIILLLFVHITL